MSFTSISFIIFFIVVLLTTLALEKFNMIRSKKIFLLLASYFFYGYWDWKFCFLLLFVTLVSYITALNAKNKTALIVGVSTPLVVLAIFKYFNFFIDSFSAMIGRPIGSLQIILPVGISFYTFQALSYVIDVRRKQIEAEKDFVNLALYISFFPQLVAGPIVKAKDFLPQLYEKRRITLAGIHDGLQLMAFGLIKKMVLADHLSVFVDDVFNAPIAYHWTTLILSIVAYSLQIYFDFSGYSDIAIGCAKCLGYDFLPNFNLPYISASVTEFWRRWHISLSTWLKEYLYISLGGNRRGKARQLVNLMITMLLGGLWHGASWTFVFWGGLNGLALCVDKFRRKGQMSIARKILNIIATYCFISFTWIFFRADTFTRAWQVIKGIFTLQSGVVQNFSWCFVAIICLLISTAFAIKKSQKEKTSINGYYPIVNLNTVSGLFIFFVMWGLLFALAFTGESPFVYFQF